MKSKDIFSLRRQRYWLSSITSLGECTSFYQKTVYIYIGVALPRVFYAAKQFSLDFSFFRASSIKNILILLSVKGICRCRYQVIPLHEAPAVRPKYWNVKFIH